MDTLNTDYGSTGLSFTLANITRTLNATWFETAGPEDTEAIQTEMKEALRQGGPETLNFYTVSFNDIGLQGLLGYATFPVSYESAPLDDGVVVRFNALTGGSFPRYGMGKTGTHEVGHWVGVRFFISSALQYIQLMCLMLSHSFITPSKVAVAPARATACWIPLPSSPLPLVALQPGTPAPARKAQIPSVRHPRSPRSSSKLTCVQQITTWTTPLTSARPSSPQARPCACRTKC